jgi:hypothetical protein
MLGRRLFGFSTSAASRPTWNMPCGAMMPCSVRWPQSVDRLRPLRDEQIPDLEHHARGLLLGTLFTATNLIVGWAAASVIASASVMSFFCRL